MQRGGGRRWNNPFDDDDDDGGFSGGGSTEAGKEEWEEEWVEVMVVEEVMTQDPARESHNKYRYIMANKRMEESSVNSLRVLNKTINMGNETTKELETQAESLDRTEREVDKIHVELDKGERDLRKIKSPFGGIANYFSRKKTVDEVTDPKGFKPTQTKGAAKPKPAPANKKQQSYADTSTGNTVVDDNLGEMEKALFQFKGIAEVMGTQLDDSDQQMDRVKYKIDRDNIKICKLNKDIKRELYK